MILFNSVLPTNLSQDDVVCDTVLDVGANIGIFAAFAAEKVGKSGLVIAVEPVPPTWEVLNYNVDLLHRPGDGEIILINRGVGDGSKEAIDFTFYPAAAGWSTMYPDASEVSDAMRIFLDRSLPTLEGMDLSLVNKVGSLAARKAPKWLIDPLARLAVSQMLAQKKEYSCQLTTVSNIIKTQGLEVVDLLKVDVERAELDVLRSIADQDWPKIRQIVMEVHDLNGALSAVRELLDVKGNFAACVVEQDTQLEGSTLYNLYATQQGS
ncbi:hypothetical protein WJX75_008210 [Coccomyxa subellipsoidea]|uniref:Methyltransferase FkbM domain-containing protein n=1 Tax=Coccomyxa subellipsoidea TaxID=248742 RepID=A0ABR2Z1F0_9CHLO